MLKRNSQNAFFNYILANFHQKLAYYRLKNPGNSSLQNRPNLVKMGSEQAGVLFRDNLKN